MSGEGALKIFDASADFIAGWVSGCAGVLVSHPFDTVKVRLQTQGVNSQAVRQYKGTWHCLTETVKHEKFRGLFKGMSSPLLGTAAWNAVVFGAYGNTVRFLAGSDISKQHDMRVVAMGGVASGIAQTVVICPLELTKTRLQIQQSKSSTLYKGLLDCIYKVWRENGFKGLYKGMAPTICRDIVGFPTYFMMFELFCRMLAKDGQSHDDLGPLSLVVAGGFAGALSWGVVFPPDVIKCRIQVDYDGRYNGMVDCIRKSFKQEGWNLFRRGLAPTMIRGFPMNAAIFSVYISMMKFYNEQQVGLALQDMLVGTVRNI